MEPKRTKTTEEKQCSYCFGCGHTRRSCKYLKSDRAFLIDVNIKYRRRTLESLVDKGICVGSLIGLEDHAWSDNEAAYIDVLTPAVIRHIYWDDINYDVALHRNSASAISDRYRTEGRRGQRMIVAERTSLGDLSMDKREPITLPYDPVLTPHYHLYSSARRDESILWHAGHKMISAIPGHIVLSTAPDNFLSVEESTKFVDLWLAENPHSKNRRKKRARIHIHFETFAPLMGKTACLNQKELSYEVRSTHT